jgi:phenylalanyl-tRNA synthetase beta subunit
MQDTEKTLAEAEVDSVITQLVAAAQQSGAVLRA